LAIGPFRATNIGILETRVVTIAGAMGSVFTRAAEVSCNGKTIELAVSSFYCFVDFGS